MRPLLLALAAAVFLVTLTATPAAAQIEGRTSIIVKYAKIVNLDALDDQGRLPPSTKLEHVLSFDVQLPPTVGICPLGTITVVFSVKGPAYATTIVSPSSVTKQQPSLFDNRIPDYATRLTIVTNPNAPTDEAGQYIVTAQAVPSGGLLSGCNARPSDPYHVGFVFVNG